MIGVNQSNLAQMNAATLDDVCADIKAYGFESVRFACDWAWLSNFFGQVDYKPLIRVKAALDKHGLIAMPCLGIHTPFMNYSAAQFKGFVAKCVQIFGNVPFYEVWNEPNIWAFYNGGGKGYVKYLKVAAPVIRAAGSEVIACGLAAFPDFNLFNWLRNHAPTTFLEAMYAAGEDNDYDYLGYHPYSISDDQTSSYKAPSSNPFGVAQVAELKAVQQSHGDTRPLAFTEVGYDTKKVKEPTAWLTEQINELESQGNIWFFCFRDTQGDGGAYGLQDSKGNFKLPYADEVKSLLT